VTTSDRLPSSFLAVAGDDALDAFVPVADEAEFPVGLAQRDQFPEFGDAAKGLSFADVHQVTAWLGVIKAVSWSRMRAADCSGGRELQSTRRTAKPASARVSAAWR